MRYEVDAVRGEERARYVLDVYDVGDHRFRIVARGPTGTHRATADDLFEALREVRREIEPAGWRLAVNGARRDTWPSRMLRDQLDGGTVYVLPLDPTVRPEGGDGVRSGAGGAAGDGRRAGGELGGLEGAPSLRSAGPEGRRPGGSWVPRPPGRGDR